MGHYATAKVAGDGTSHLPRIDREAFTDEFPRFKALMVHLILSKKLDPEKCEFKEFCQDHVSELLSLPTVLFLIQIALILPMNSVPCERGFSKMKLIKCKGRSRLDTQTLDWLMNISINGPPYLGCIYERIWSEVCNKIYSDESKEEWFFGAVRCSN